MKIMLLGREIRLFILDVDGVLTKFGSIIDLVTEVAEEFGLPTRNVALHFKRVRRGDFPQHSRFKDDIKKMWPELSEGEVSGLVKAMREKEKRYTYEAYGAVYSFLFWLISKDVKLAICTRNNKEALSRKLSQAGIREEWFCVTSIPGKYSKPDPRVIYAILEKTGVQKENAVFIGDWFPDINAARNADVLFIGTTCGVLSKEAFLRHGVPEENIVESLPNLYFLINGNGHPVR